MIDEPVLRPGRSADWPALEALYRAAFPNEDLLPLLRDLLPDQAVLSLVAEIDRQVVGHVAFTRCGIEGREDEVALLAPLAVAPSLQKQGIGSALVREGLRRLRDAGARQVQTLGDPGYYGRFGFRPDPDIAPPYPLPDAWRDAWQRLVLIAGEAPLAGRLLVSSPWQRPELWRE